VEDFDVRSVVVAGARRSVVFDTLARPRDMEAVTDLVPHLPRTLVYSHGDWDHVWGTGGLAGHWEEILAHDGCLARFQWEIPRTLEEKRVSAPDEFDGVVLIPPTRTFLERDILDLGGITLELSHLPGHTFDSIVGYIPQWNILFAGDSAEAPIPFLNEAEAVDRWVLGLEGWISRLEEQADASPPPLVIPSHGPEGGSELLHQNRSYLMALMEGREPDLPDALSPFYRETHAANLLLVRRGRGGSS